MVENMGDVRALDPFFRIIEQGLAEFVDGDNFFDLLDRCYELCIHHSPSTSSVVLEYSSEGMVVATRQPYTNRYVSVVAIKDRKVSAWRDYLDPLRVCATVEGRPSNRTLEK